MKLLSLASSAKRSRSADDHEEAATDQTHAIELQSLPSAGTNSTKRDAPREDGLRAVDTSISPQLTIQEERRLWKKVDARLLPMLTVVYLVSVFNQGSIVHARSNNLEVGLNLTDSQFRIALVMFTIPYCVFAIPSVLLLRVLRPSRWLAALMVTSGIVITLTGLVKSYASLLGVRICLGALEAGIFPGIIYYLTLWYPRHLLHFRIALLFGAASVANSFSGLIAYGIGRMAGKGGLLGWSWIFILEGIMTVIVGVVVFFVLLDLPSTATALSLEERAFIQLRKKYDNSSVGEEEGLERRHVIAALKDWQVWMHVLVLMSVLAPLAGVSLFIPSITRSWSHSPAVTQLLTVPPYIVAAIVMCFAAFYSDKLKMRFPVVLAGLVCCMIGFLMNICKLRSGVRYFGTFFIVIGSYSALPGSIAWLSNNLSGQSKRATGLALQIGVGNLSTAVVYTVYRQADAPRYLLGHGVELAFVGVGLLVLPVTVAVYTRINGSRQAALRRRRLRGEGPEGRWTKEEMRMLGDRAAEFKYTL